MNPRIIYMGTPEFSIAPLEALLSNNFNVVAVVTAPDMPAGRGKKILPPPLKPFAESHNIPVLQPVKLKDPDFILTLKDFKPDLFIVVAFRMLPKQVWTLPKYGTFNLHSSLLPQYRGAAPINWAIINGETESGLSTFFIDEKIDTGEILLQKKLSISKDETAGELHDRMMIAGGELVLKTVRGILDKSLQAKTQKKLITKESELKPAPKIFKEDCKIIWDEDILKIHNFIRGLNPYPTAYSLLLKENEKIPFKIFKASYTEIEHSSPYGSIQSDGKKLIKVAAKGGYINLLEIQQAGKKRITTKAFLAGFKGINECKFI